MSSAGDKKMGASSTTTPDQDIVQPSSPVPDLPNLHDASAPLPNTNTQAINPVPADLHPNTWHSFDHSSDPRSQSAIELSIKEPAPSAPAEPSMPEARIGAISQLDFNKSSNKDLTQVPHLLEASSEPGGLRLSPTPDPAHSIERRSSTIILGVAKKSKPTEKIQPLKDYAPSAPPAPPSKHARQASSNIRAGSSSNPPPSPSLPREASPTPSSTSSSFSIVATKSTPPLPPIAEIKSLRSAVQKLVSDFLILQGAFKRDLGTDPEGLTVVTTYGPDEDTGAGEYLTEMDQDLGSLLRKVGSSTSGEIEAERRERHVKKFEGLRGEYEGMWGRLDALRKRLEGENMGEEGVFVYTLGTRYQVLGNQDDVGGGGRLRRGKGGKSEKIQAKKVTESVKVGVGKRSSGPRSSWREEDADDTTLFDIAIGSVKNSRDEQPVESRDLRRSAVSRLAIVTGSDQTAEPSTNLKLEGTSAVPSRISLKRKATSAVTPVSCIVGNEEASDDHEHAPPSKRSRTDAYQRGADHASHRVSILDATDSDSEEEDEDVLSIRSGIKAKMEPISFPKLVISSFKRASRLSQSNVSERILASRKINTTGQVRKEKSSQRISQHQEKMTKPGAVVGYERIQDSEKGVFASKGNEEDSKGERRWNSYVRKRSYDGAGVEREAKKSRTEQVEERKKKDGVDEDV